MTEANDRLFKTIGGNMDRSPTKFPGLNAMGETPIEVTPEGGNNKRDPFGGPPQSGVVAKGRWGGSGGKDSRQLTPNVKSRAGQRKVMGSR